MILTLQDGRGDARRAGTGVRDGERSPALFDCSKAVRELGYRPAPLREILEDCHRWMLAAGLLGKRAASPL